MQVPDLVANAVGVLAGLGLVSGVAILMGWKDDVSVALETPSHAGGGDPFPGTRTG